ncbi:MAG TPA: GDP-mannose 4,6-dehydratase [Acidimicrobiales bacterium]|nr:GDP-mannose 4,6-dehydratase [Acidimicrobiales bacterium]
MLHAVTGADGFIGSHLVEGLVAEGHRVRALALYTSLGTWGWLDTLPREVLDNVEVVAGDVRDPEQMAAFCEGVDTIFHLAALIAIPYSYVAPRSYLETNAAGTLNVLEGVRRHAVRRMVHTSTSEVYGTAQRVPIDEDHPLQGQSPYSASKIAADQMVEAFVRSFEVPAVTLRPFNTYGPRQSARAVIPTVVSQIAAGRREIKLGALEPTRDFNFVADTVAAFMSIGAGEDKLIGQTFNAGSGREISVGDMVRTVVHVMGADVVVKADESRLRPAGSEVMRLLADRSRLEAATGWIPATTLEQGLSTTAEWFSDPANLARYRVDTYTV